MMRLPILAALLIGSGYATYTYMVYGGESQPNPASWGLWAILSVLTALTFWKGSKNAFAATQFFTGAGACIVVWLYATIAGKFSPWETMDWIIFGLCLAVIAVWVITKKATYGNVLIGYITIIAFIPTIEGLLTATAREHPLPWILWTAGYIVTIVDIVRRRFKEVEVDWRLMLITPSIDTLVHSSIAIAAFL